MILEHRRHAETDTHRGHHEQHRDQKPERTISVVGIRRRRMDLVECFAAVVGRGHWLGEDIAGTGATWQLTGFWPEHARRGLENRNCGLRARFRIVCHRRCLNHRLAGRTRAGHSCESHWNCQFAAANLTHEGEGFSCHRGQWRNLRKSRRRVNHSEILTISEFSDIKPRAAVTR